MITRDVFDCYNQTLVLHNRAACFHQAFCFHYDFMQCERSYRLKAVASLTAEAGSISLRPIAVATLL